MSNVVIRVVDSRGNSERKPISTLTPMGNGPAISLKHIKHPAHLKCPSCGHPEFREGPFINFYDCDGCFETIMAY